MFESIPVIQIVDVKCVTKFSSSPIFGWTNLIEVEQRQPAPGGRGPDARETFQERGVLRRGDDFLQEGATRLRSDDADSQQARGRLRGDSAHAHLIVAGATP